MIIATSVDFRYPFAASKAQSNNITLDCLNPEFFQIHDFVNFSVTQGYQPKVNTYLYAWHQHEHDPTEYKEHPTQASQLIYLGNTKDNSPGTPLTATNYSQITSWGNPFYHEYLTGQRQLYTSTKKPSDLVTGNQASENLKQVSKLTIPLIRRVRYNPEKDKGESNTIYLVKTC